MLEREVPARWRGRRIRHRFGRWPRSGTFSRVSNDPGIRLDAEPTPVQERAILLDEGGLVLQGPAGCGRSTTLDLRLKRLSEGADPGEGAVLVLSSALAAAAHRARLDAANVPAATVRVLTWEQLAETVLRERAPEVGVDPGFEIVGRPERLAMLLARFDELPLRHHQIRGNPAGLLRSLLPRLDRVKAWELAGQEEPGGRAGDPLLAAEIDDLLAFHDAMLREVGCLDRLDLFRITADLLCERGLPAGTVGTSWSDLLVDELELAGPVELELLGACLGLTETRSFVGALDPQGAEDSQVGMLDRTLAGVERLPLERAWRAGPEALKVAEAILGTAGYPVPACSAEGSGTVRFWGAETVQAEAQAVGREVEHLVGEGRPTDSVAVVVPNPGLDGPVVQAALAERGVEAFLDDGSGLFREPEVRDVIAWVRALTDPADGSAVARVLVRPPIRIRPADLAHVTVIARRRKLDMVQAAEAALESPRVSPESRERLEAFLELFAAASGALDTHRPDAFLRRLVERVGFRRENLFSARPETADRLIALSQLIETASAWSRREPDGSARDFAAFLLALAEAGLGVSNGPGVERRGKVRITDLETARGGDWETVFLLGSERLGPDEARPLAAVIQAAGSEVLLSRVLPGPNEPARDAELFEAAIAASPAIEEPLEEELFGPEEGLHAAYRSLRDEVLEESWRVGRELVEPRLDTALDLERAVARYLELLKLAALAQRPGDGTARDAIDAVNGLLGQVATPGQLAELEASTLDPLLLEREHDRVRRQALLDSRSEPSLDAFLPRKGGNLRLSATDLDLYMTCPLKYKFARVFGIPTPQTVNQRFGILVHSVLHRFHREDGDAGPSRLAELLDSGWSRAGLGETGDEQQFRERARVGLAHYWEAESRSSSEVVSLERQFEFRVGSQVVRGRVDRVDRHPDGTLEVIDYKTGQRVDPDRLGGDIQLALYRLGAEEAWGVEAGAGSYYYVLDGVKEEIPAAPGDRERIERTVGEVGEGILGQDFEPKPSPRVCGWCDFRLVCPAAEA